MITPEIARQKQNIARAQYISTGLPQLERQFEDTILGFDFACSACWFPICLRVPDGGSDYLIDALLRAFVETLEGAGWKIASSSSHNNTVTIVVKGMKLK